MSITHLPEFHKVNMVAGMKVIDCLSEGLEWPSAKTDKKASQGICGHHCARTG